MEVLLLLLTLISSTLLVKILSLYNENMNVFFSSVHCFYGTPDSA